MTERGPSRVPSLSRVYAGIVERMPVGVVVWHLDADERTMRLVGGNAAAAQSVDMDLSVGIGRPMRELFPVVTEERERMYIEVARSKQSRELGEVHHVAKDGSIRIALSRVVPADDNCVAVLFEDITDKKQAQTELELREERFRRLIENSADAVALVAADGCILFASDSVERIVGYTAAELEGQTSFGFIHPDDLARADAHFRTIIANPGQLYTKQLRCRHKNGTWRRIEIVTVNRLDDATLHGVVANFRDVTERFAMEEQLRQAEEQLSHARRMEAVGKLAGGVAHDFNNLLSVILGSSALVLERIASGDSLHGEITDIHQAGQQAAELTRQLLAFSRQQILAPVVVDLNAVISKMDRMLRRIIGEDVEFRTLPFPGLRMVRVDPGQIEQVIMNLVVNARDAMPDGGTLTIETGNVALDEAYAKEHVGVTPGPHVLLAITDTGVGMDKATQERIFEPFFTTKRRGKGTGLGLSTVFGIVKQSGGSIWLYSEPGRGTTFKVYFPESAEDRVGRPSQAPPRRTGGSETVLVVEDDPLVRSVACEILRSRGYTVFGATAADALRKCASYDGPIHLLLTDVIMPEMSGRELAQRISALRPTIKVLYMSGYTDNTIVHHGVLDPGIAFLQKPITPDALCGKVREVLDSD